MPLGFGFVFFLVLSTGCRRAPEHAVAESVAKTDTGPPRILVTNDDGYATEGIAAVAEKLAEFADVVVVAPKENESGSSQSARVYWSQDGIRVYEVAIGEHLTGYAIDGTPTDCVFLGLKIFGKEKPFDFVVSGINHGANIGIANYYSGTDGWMGATYTLPHLSICEGGLARTYFSTRCWRERVGPASPSATPGQASFKTEF